MLTSTAVDQSKKVSNSIGALAEKVTAKALPDLSTLSSQEAGGVIRTLAENVSLELGNAASVAAVQSYKDLTDDALRALYETTPWGAARGAIDAERTARFLARARSYDGLSFQELDAMVRAAGTGPIDGAILQARMWAKNGFEGYVPKVINVKERIAANLEGIVGNSMSKYVNGSYQDAAYALENGVGRMVENLYRDTIATNSQGDGFVTGYQRVASPTACAFCLTVALNEYTTFEQSGGYHDRCGCSTVPVYRGVSAYEPDYYAGFREDYTTATDAVQSSNPEDVLAAIRTLTGRK
jgi:hypothetical protein